MAIDYWGIKEINTKKYLPYINGFLVLYIYALDLFINDFMTVLGTWTFSFYLFAVLLVIIVSPITWRKSDNNLVWILRLLVLISLITISLTTYSPFVFFLYYLHTLTIIFFYKNFREFLVGTALLTITYVITSFINPVLRMEAINWGFFAVFISFLSVHLLHNQKENNKKLRQLSKIFKIMLSSTNNGIQFIDAQGHTRILNPAAEIIYGRCENETSGAYDWELYYKGRKFDENGKYTSLITETLETGKVHKDDIRTFIDKHGKQKTYLVETFRVYDDAEKEIMGAIGIYRDISEQKEMERQLLDAHYEMANMAVTDELTELYNFRYFRQRLPTEIAKAYKSTLSLLIIDIDFFKKYNDLYGHLEGDKVLREIGGILKESFRTTDIVARYGGEEFTVILPGMDKQKAIEVAERIRIKIKETSIRGEEKLPNGKLTVTIGVSTVPSDAKNAEELIKLADNALYRGKNAARDVVVTYEEGSYIAH